MSDVTGTLRRTHAGREYELRLTFGAIAGLQADHGVDLGGLLSEDGITGVPPFGLLLDIVSAALRKGQRDMARPEADELADELLSADPQLFAALLKTAFPDQRGNGDAAAEGS